VATECDELGGARCSQARRASLIYAEVRAEATQRGFDAQSKTGGSGRPALMASQQVERAAELQNPEVRAELNWRIHECERKCLPVADSARFRRRVRVQDNRPRASRLKASGVRAKQKRRTGDAIRRGDPTGGYTSVPAVFQWHLYMSRGSSTRE
jgi:hypothetical protein